MSWLNHYLSSQDNFKGGSMSEKQKGVALYDDYLSLKKKLSVNKQSKAIKVKKPDLPKPQDQTKKPDGTDCYPEYLGD